MNNMMLWLVATGLIITPATANADQYENTDVRSGAFAGARFQIALGGRSTSKPRAHFTIAPAVTRISRNNGVQTTIGEGAALNWGARPSLTLMGVRADQALGISPSVGTDGTRKLGLSSGGWVAVGVGAIALAGGILFLHVRDVAEDNSD